MREGSKTELNEGIREADRGAAAGNELPRSPGVNETKCPPSLRCLRSAGWAQPLQSSGSRAGLHSEQTRPVGQGESSSCCANSKPTSLSCIPSAQAHGLHCGAFHPWRQHSVTSKGPRTAQHLQPWGQPAPLHSPTSPLTPHPAPSQPHIRAKGETAVLGHRNICLPAACGVCPALTGGCCLRELGGNEGMRSTQLAEGRPVRSQCFPKQQLQKGLL